jgi:preprotein translocase subunit SecE
LGEVAESNRRGEDATEHVDDVFDDAVDDDAVAEGKRGVVKERVSRAEKTEGIGFFGRIGRFFREIVAELRKVIWPTRNELLTYAAVVIVFVTVMVTIVGLLDLAYAKGVLIVFGNPK